MSTDKNTFKMPDTTQDQAIVSAARAFMEANHSTYRKSTQLANRIVDFIQENDLRKTDVDSWQKAYDSICREEVFYDTGKFRDDGTKEIYLDEEALDKIPADRMKELLRINPLFARGVNLILEEKQ